MPVSQLPTGRVGGFRSLDAAYAVVTKAAHALIEAFVLKASINSPPIKGVLDGVGRSADGGLVATVRYTVPDDSSASEVIAMLGERIKKYGFKPDGDGYFLKSRISGRDCPIRITLMNRAQFRAAYMSISFWSP